MNRDVSSGKFHKFEFHVRLEFLSRIFPKHEASCMQFVMIQEMPQQMHQQLRPNPKSSGLELLANPEFHFKIKISSLSAPISRNGVSFFKLTIEE